MSGNQKFAPLNASPTTTGTGLVRIDGSRGSFFRHIAGAGNNTVQLENIRPGQIVFFAWVQDAVGARTLTVDGGSVQAAVFQGASASYVPNAGANQSTLYMLVGMDGGAAVEVGKSLT